MTEEQEIKQTTKTSPNAWIGYLIPIVDRAEKLHLLKDEYTPRYSLGRDLKLAHKSVGIDFEKLLNSNDEDFEYDITGIQVNIKAEYFKTHTCRQFDTRFTPRSILLKEVIGE